MQKVKIYLPYGEKRPAKDNNPGERYQPHYVERYDEHGHPYLVKDGETDTYEVIQSHKEECDINLLMARYAAGDMSVINHGAVYADISEIPTTMVEMVNFINGQKEKYNSLPAEIKEKFENSFERWAAGAGTEDWLNKMGLNEKRKEEASKDEPKQ